MKKLATLFLAAGILVSLAVPADAARVFVSVGPSFGYYPGYYRPYYPGYAYGYPGYYPSYYAAPPVAADQTSPTFLDSLGRTCRQFATTNGVGSTGTACLMPDGSWRTVE